MGQKYDFFKLQRFKVVKRQYLRVCFSFLKRKDSAFLRSVFLLSAVSFFDAFESLSHQKKDAAPIRAIKESLLKFC